MIDSTFPDQMIGTFNNIKIYTEIYMYTADCNLCIHTLIAGTPCTISAWPLPEVESSAPCWFPWASAPACASLLPTGFRWRFRFTKTPHRWNGNKYNYNLACVTFTQKSSNIFCDQPDTVKSNALSSHLDGLLRMALENRRELAQLAPLVVCQRYLYTYIHICTCIYIYVYMYIKKKLVNTHHPWYRQYEYIDASYEPLSKRPFGTVQSAFKLNFPTHSRAKKTTGWAWTLNSKLSLPTFNVPQSFLIHQLKTHIHHYNIIIR